MNKVIFVFFLLVASSTKSFSSSNSVDVETAKTVAQSFMSGSGRLQTSKSALNVVVEKFGNQNSIYVNNFPEGGWVMVSAENSTVPILSRWRGHVVRADVA